MSGRSAVLSHARARLAPRIKGTVMEKGAFLKGYEKAGESLSQKLDLLAKDPDEEAVHDARTAMRRYEAWVDVLPKSIRKSPEMRELLKSHRKLMKRSAKVRDLDVTRGKVSRHKGPGGAQLLAKIDRKRPKLAEDMLEAVASARRLPLPAVRSKGVTQKWLQKRHGRVTGRLSSDIDALLPLVIMDPARLKELHKMRIDSKKLRYTLELTAEAGSPEVARLQEWQDALGAIHDWDVATAFLKEAGVSGTGGLLRAWVRERDREYDEFVRSVLSPA